MKPENNTKKRKGGTGLFLEKKHKKQILPRLDNAKNPNILFQEGNHYRDEAEDDNDITEAISCYQRAAEQGHAQAAISLANIYEDERDIGKNLPEVTRLLISVTKSGTAAESAWVFFCLAELCLPDNIIDADNYLRKWEDNYKEAVKNNELLLENDDYPTYPSVIDLFNEGQYLGLGREVGVWKRKYEQAIAELKGKLPRPISKRVIDPLPEEFYKDATINEPGTKEATVFFKKNRIVDYHTVRKKNQNHSSLMIKPG